MQNLPYFFLLLKKNIALWTLIATGSFSKIDTVHTEYTRMSPNFMILKNYSLSNTDSFKEINIMSTGWSISMDFRTSNPKYLDSMKYYFGTSSISGSMSGGYTINGTAVNNSNNMLEPIDIGLNRKVSVFLGRTGEHEYKISFLLNAKNYIELEGRFLDSVRRIDSALYGLRGGPAPHVERLVDSALRLGMGVGRKLTEPERKDLINRQINILNKAIKADSSYIDSYKLKFGCEQELRHYDSLIITGKKILKLTTGQPEAETILRMGECYELVHKIDSARIYYQRALSLYDQQMSDIGKNGMAYNYELSCKALVLILLNKEKEGRAIFKELSENPRVDDLERKLYHQYFMTSRDEFLQKLNP